MMTMFNKFASSFPTHPHPTQHKSVGFHTSVDDEPRSERSKTTTQP